MILDKIPEIIQRIITTKITYVCENINFSDQQQIRSFLQDNIQNIFQQNTSDIISSVPSIMFGDLESFTPKLHNSLNKNEGWNIKWKLWNITSTFTNKLLYYTYASQWEILRNKVLLSALKDCSKYFSQYFQLLKINKSIKVKEEILKLYKSLDIIMKKIAPKEDFSEFSKIKCRSIYKSWLSDRESLFKLKKQLKIPQAKTEFYIPSIPIVLPKKTDEMIEGQYDNSNLQKSYIKVLYDMDDASSKEVEVVLKIGSVMKYLIESITNSKKIETDHNILNQAQFNSFLIKTTSEKYALLYDAFRENCANFINEWQKIQTNSDPMKTLLKSVRMAEEFMMECLNQFCSEIDLYQKIFAMHIADISSLALTLYHPKILGIFKKVLLI